MGGDAIFESFMGPTRKVTNGMEAGGVGWVFRKSWDRADLKGVAKAERVVTLSVETTGGTLELHSIYSQSHDNHSNWRKIDGNDPKESKPLWIIYKHAERAEPKALALGVVRGRYPDAPLSIQGETPLSCLLLSQCPKLAA